MKKMAITSSEQPVQIPKPLWRKIQRAAFKNKPRTSGKAIVALACEEFLAAQKANK